MRYEKDKLKERAKKVSSSVKYGTPRELPSYFAITRRRESEDQFILYTVAKDTAFADDEAFETLFDPHKLSGDGTAAMGSISFDRSGQRVAIGVSYSGSDWREVRIIDVKSRQEIDTPLKWVKFSSTSWLKDGSGFFYARYPEPSVDGEKMGTETNANESHRVCFHAIGTPQSDDVEVYFPTDPKYTTSATVSDCGAYVVFSSYQGTDTNNVEVARISELGLSESSRPSEVKIRASVHTVVDHFSSIYNYIGNNDTRMLFLTNNGASRSRIVEIDIQLPFNGSKIDQKEVLAELPGTDVIQSAAVVGKDSSHMLLSINHDVKNIAKHYEIDWTGSVASVNMVHEIEFEEPVCIDGMSGDITYQRVFFRYSTLTSPGKILSYDLENHTAQPFRIIVSLSEGYLSSSSISLHLHMRTPPLPSLSVSPSFLLRTAAVYFGSISLWKGWMHRFFPLNRFSIRVMMAR